jgi:hypothetical protein
MLLGLASAIVLGATNLSEAEQLQADHKALLGTPASDSTARRILAWLDEPALTRIAKARAKVVTTVWLAGLIFRSCYLLAKMSSAKADAIAKSRTTRRDRFMPARLSGSF